MMNKLILAALPVGLGAAALLLLKKNKESGSKETAAPAKGGKTKMSAPVEPKNVKTAAYSFISGFKDAATVEVTFPYDGERYAFEVKEDAFLTESGDSHVGVLEGEGFSAQFEYGSFYTGEDFEKHSRELRNQHPDLTPASYGKNEGLRFLDGDVMCMAFPIPEDEHSFLLVSIVKAGDNDDELDAIADYADLKYMLGGMSFSRS